MFIKNKKGVELTLETVIVFIILLVVLVVISFFFVSHYTSSSNSLFSIGGNALNKAKNLT